jgi:hypothetical protein
MSLYEKISLALKRQLIPLVTIDADHEEMKPLQLANDNNYFFKRRDNLRFGV